VMVPALAIGAVERDVARLAARTYVADVGRRLVPAGRGGYFAVGRR
jgi:hypothetical protein